MLASVATIPDDPQTTTADGATGLRAPRPASSPRRLGTPVEADRLRRPLEARHHLPREQLEGGAGPGVVDAPEVERAVDPREPQRLPRPLDDGRAFVGIAHADSPLRHPPVDGQLLDGQRGHAALHARLVDLRQVAPDELLPLATRGFAILPTVHLEVRGYLQVLRGAASRRGR